MICVRLCCPPQDSRSHAVGSVHRVKVEVEVEVGRQKQCGWLSEADATQSITPSHGQCVGRAAGTRITPADYDPTSPRLDERLDEALAAL